MRGGRKTVNLSSKQECKNNIRFIRRFMFSVQNCRHSIYLIFYLTTLGVDCVHIQAGSPLSGSQTTVPPLYAGLPGDPAAAAGPPARTRAPYTKHLISSTQNPRIQVMMKIILHLQRNNFFLFRKSCIQETQNLLTDADCSTNNKMDKISLWFFFLGGGGFRVSKLPSF